MKILGGVYPHPQYGGEIFIEGSLQQFSGVRDAEKPALRLSTRNFPRQGDDRRRKYFPRT